MVKEKKMSVLILGDGNFSFSLALAQMLFGDLSPAAALEYFGFSHDQNLLDNLKWELICTSFDTRQELLEKYKESAQILDKLEYYQSTKVKVLHRINAWELERHFPNQTFDVIVWNHPHLAREDYRLHRFLMAHFLDSARNVLSHSSTLNQLRPSTTVGEPGDAGKVGEGGRICVSLVEGQEVRWNLVGQASIIGLTVIGRSPFQEFKYPGYVCKRNTTGQSFKNQHTLNHVRCKMQSFIYRFSQQDCRDVVSSSNHVVVDPVSIEGHSRSDDDTVEFILYDHQKDLKQKRHAKQIQKKKQQQQQKQEIVDDSKSGKKRVEYKCPDCTRSFPSLRGIRQHFHGSHVLKLYDTAKESTDLFPCELCDKRCSKESDLLQHMISKHLNVSPSHLGDNTKEQEKDQGEAVDESENNYEFIPCKLCDQSVQNSQEGMQVHLESLKPLIGQVLTCPRDGKPFLELRAFQQHMKTCEFKQLRNDDVIFSIS